MGENAQDSSPIMPANPLRIRLLGAPMLTLPESEFQWHLHDQKAWALLFYLAASGRSQSRDHLATLLWGESLESNARHSLRSCLYRLRNALPAAGADILIVNSHEVRLSLDENQCDVVRFRRLLAAKNEPELKEAVTLYQGPFLEGFAVPDAPVFDQWHRIEAARLSQEYLSALHILAGGAESRQAWADAVDYVQRMVQLDPLDEKNLRWLIELYARTGSTGRALRLYQQFKESLRRELGLVPSAETEEVLRDVLRPSAVPHSHTSTGEPTSPELFGYTFEPVVPLVGREGALAELFSLSQVAETGNGVTVLLHGEAGMGKTRLLNEVAARHTGSGSQWIVLRGSCSPFDDLLSYGPFYEAFRTAAPGDLTDLLVVEHGNAPDSAGNVMWRVLETLRLLTRSGPLLLAIDDLQWANSATLRLFGFLATRIRALPVLLIGTIQHPEAIPAIRRLLAVGRHRGEVHLVHVTPLTLEAVTDALSLLEIDAESVTSLAEWLQDRSGGSPFILGEILSQLRSDAVLTREDSTEDPTWHLDAARWLRRRVQFTLPATTHDLLSWRLAPVAPEGLRLLEVLAVAGQPLSLGLLRDLLGERSGRVLQQVEDLLARGLLVEAPEDALALPHHLLRETLLSRLSHRRRRTLHRQLVAAMERSPALDAEGSLRQLALHAVAGEDPDRARRYGLRVMDDLLQDQPNAETLRFVHQLRELLAPSAVPLELMKLAHELGRLHQSLGQLEAASHYHQQHFALARQAGDVVAQATAYCEIGELALLTNDYLAAATAADSALQLTPPLNSSIPTGRSYRLLGAARAMEGRDLGEAVHYLQQAVAIHREAGSYGDLCADLFELGNVAAQRGDLVEALSLYEEAATAATAGHDYYFLALAHNNIAYHSLLLGRVDAAAEAVAKGHRLAETHELVGALLHLYSTQGEIHLYLSEWEKASLAFRRGLALAEELGNLERQAGYRAGLALAMRGQGNYAEAVRLLEAARGLIVAEGYWHLYTRVLLYLAETFGQQHRLEEAWPLLEEAASIANSQGRVLLRLQAECLRGELLSAFGRTTEAEALFADLLIQATELGLPLEVARIQRIQSTRDVTLQ